MKISGNDWRLTADGEYFFPSCRKRVRAICDCDDSRSVYLSLRTLAIFLSSWPKRIPHFRVTNRGDVERWGRMRRRFEYIVQCTERSALLDHECFTTITPGRCWVCCCVWNWRKCSACNIRCFADVTVADVAEGEEEDGGEEDVVDFVDVEFTIVCCLLVNANGISCAGSSLNRWSPSRWRIASTIVSRFCRDVFAIYSLACGMPSSKEFDGEGNLQSRNLSLTNIEYLGFL